MIAQRNSGAHECIGKVVVVVVVVNRYARRGVRAGVLVRARLVVLLVADGGILLDLLDAQQDPPPTHTPVTPPEHKLQRWFSIQMVCAVKGHVVLRPRHCISPCIVQSNAAEHLNTPPPPRFQPLDQ